MALCGRRQKQMVDLLLTAAVVLLRWCCAGEQGLPNKISKEVCCVCDEEGLGLLEFAGDVSPGLKKCSEPHQA